MYIFSVAPSVLQWLTCRVVTETAWPPKPQTFTMWLFIQKKFASSCSTRRRTFKPVLYVETERLT